MLRTESRASEKAETAGAGAGWQYNKKFRAACKAKSLAPAERPTLTLGLATQRER